MITKINKPEMARFSKFKMLFGLKYKFYWDQFQRKIEKFVFFSIIFSIIYLTLVQNTKNKHFLTLGFVEGRFKNLNLPNLYLSYVD